MDEYYSTLPITSIMMPKKKSHKVNINTHPINITGVDRMRIHIIPWNPKVPNISLMCNSASYFFAYKYPLLVLDHTHYTGF